VFVVGIVVALSFFLSFFLSCKSYLRWASLNLRYSKNAGKSKPLNYPRYPRIIYLSSFLLNKLKNTGFVFYRGTVEVLLLVLVKVGFFSPLINIFENNLEQQLFIYIQTQNNGGLM